MAVADSGRDRRAVGEHVSRSGPTISPSPRPVLEGDVADGEDEVVARVIGAACGSTIWVRMRQRFGGCSFLTEHEQRCTVPETFQSRGWPVLPTRRSGRV